MGWETSNWMYSGTTFIAGWPEFSEKKMLEGCPIPRMNGRPDSMKTGCFTTDHLNRIFAAV
jgi:hypothetical protein